MCKSRNGVYYDLEKSPYEYRNSWGDIFKFSSQFRLDLFNKHRNINIKKAIKTLDDLNSKIGTNYNLSDRDIKEIENETYKNMIK